MYVTVYLPQTMGNAEYYCSADYCRIYAASHEENADIE
jgi:hypothetical protein